MKEYLEDLNYTDHAAYQVALRVAEVSEKEFKACTEGRISGAVDLIKLYRTDIRYRRSGKNEFLAELARILIYSKKQRNEAMN